MIQDAVRKVMSLYPRIFFACHTRHVPDPKTRRLLSAHQASILDHLDEMEPISLAHLAMHMGVTPATMSIAVERLVRKGYVVRARDPVDTRRLNLRLSAGGLRVRETKTVLDPKRVRGLLARLSSRERDDAVRGLAILARAAEAEMHGLSSKRSWRRRGRVVRPAG